MGRIVTHPDVTKFLEAASVGDARAADRLLPLVYDELRGLAMQEMARESPGHTLEPTAVVHEVYLKLVGQNRVEWRGRAHFFAVAAQAIRRILVDHARGRAAAKRGGDRIKLEFDEQLVATFERSIDLLELDVALAELAKSHPRHARIVESRFFGGLTVKGIASVLGIGTATVEREWRFARAVLYRRLSADTRAHS
ncbi:MAG: sigma-70 family RNA polymerase sigma factor [Phycisphaerae bacterium]|jgi:RNA polymerase sigma factor (TIGR02999 family)